MGSRPHGARLLDFEGSREPHRPRLTSLICSIFGDAAVEVTKVTNRGRTETKDLAVSVDKTGTAMAS